MPFTFDNHRARRVTFAALVVFATACSDDVADELDVVEAAPVTVDQSIEQRSGSVLVEFNAVESTGISVHAQFLAVRGVSTATALHALDVWTPDRDLDLDACTVQTPPLASEEAASVRLHLLDVGPIAVSALDHSIRLEARRVPDLRSFSGVVYGNEEGFDIEQAFLPYEPQARYHIVAPGGAEAGGFHVSLLAPSVPEIETVGGRFAVDPAPIPLHGDDLELRWAAAQEQETELYLEIGSHLNAPVLSCRVEDDGYFIVPATILDQLEADALDLTLRRIDSVDLAIDGVEEGAFVFASTTQASVTP